MGSFSIALTGLKAQTAALNTVGNNLANLNTTAYKEQTTEFSDLFYRQIGTAGSGDPLQQGLGVRVQSTESNFSAGSLQATGNATDMAIQGNGFFVVSNGGVQELTRAGNFQLSNSGQLQTTDGYSVQGYQAVDGAVSAGSSIGGLSLPIGQTQAAQATSQFSLTANLNSGASVGTNYSTALTLYDSLGASHAANVTFTKTAANQWSYVVSLPSGDATGTPMNNTGTLTFNASGKLTSPTGNVANMTFPGMADGASDLTTQWSLYDASGNGMISQSSATSAASATTQNGFASGSYEGFAVATDGTVSAEYSNGQTQIVGQVALANVGNVQGLERAGGNAYVTTSASGEASIGVANSGGRGSIADDTLESSNVDISTEFANLIVAQRGFEANSKTITAFDTETQATINMIR